MESGRPYTLQVRIHCSHNCTGYHLSCRYLKHRQENQHKITCFIKEGEGNWWKLMEFKDRQIFLFNLNKGES